MGKKIIFMTGSVILLVGIVISVIFVRQSRMSQKSYDEYSITRGSVRQVIDVDATLQPSVYADISTEIPTLIEWVGIEINETVIKGQNILRLDKDALNAQVRSARLAVERAELSEQESRRKSSRMSSKQILSLKKASQQAREALQGVYTQVKKTTLKAPIDGVVIVQNAHVGEVAQGKLVRIIDPSSLQLEALIPEVDIARVHVGDTALIVLDAYGDRELQGKITLIETGSTRLQNITYYKAIITMDVYEDIVIRDGMHAEVDIEFMRKNDVLSVPRASVSKDNQGYFAYISNPTTDSKKLFVKKYFEAGLVGDENVEIVSGLSEGQNIVYFNLAGK